MTQPVKNTCTPSSVYGGFNHTLFLGCSVMSFSASVGWNEQVSECTVQLVYDPCTAPAGHAKHYYDSTLDHGTTTAADPGFIGESVNIVGCPAYFRVNDFEFSGIIQSWVKNNSTSGNPVYQVKLVSPQQILEGVQLIINEYAGGVGNTPNLFNCFGYMESFGSTCPQTYLETLPPIPDNYSLGDEDPDGAIFGTPAGGYGGAQVNENGMQWNRIATAFNMLANATPVIGNMWNGGTNGGRVFYKGTSSSFGYGLLPTTHPDGFTEYYVDISELPAVPTFWRMNGLSVGLLDCIKSVCEESGYDFYIEMCYVQNGTLDASGVTKFIKIRTVSRAAQPGSFNKITTFASANNALQTSYGQELRNEVMSSFVVGGNRETIYQIEQDNDPENDGQPANPPADDIILPFFGFTEDGNMIVPEKDVNDFWIFDIDTFSINERLKVLALPPVIEMKEFELLFALGGYDSWITMEAEAAQSGNPTDIGTVINAANMCGPLGMANLVGILAAGNEIAPRDCVKAIAKAFPGAKGIEGQIAEDLQAIFDWVNNIATTYYGKQFAVRVPYTCAYEDSESGTVIHSELPNQDGWTEHEAIIGLDRNSIPMEKFKNDSYKYEAMVRFDDANTLAFNKLDQNEVYVDVGVNAMWAKVSVEESYVYHDASTLFVPRVVISLDTPVNYIEDDAENPQAARLLAMILAQFHGRPRAEIEAAIGKVGAQELFGVVPYIPVMPNAAAFGLKSNITTYGPWYNPGPAGQVVVQREEGLVPWEYGDVATMAQAGQSIADAQITNMQVGETGNIEIPGYPEVPLGAEIGAVGGGFFGAGTNLVENRTASTGSFSGTHVVDGPVTINYGYFSYGGSWTGLYGPNVTGITVSVGPDGVTTSYELRTFTPKFGRFAKYNAERLKQIGQQRMKAQKQLKAIMAQNVRKNVIANFAKNREKAGRMFDAGTPHECYVGQLYTFHGRTRTLVANESLFNTAIEVKEDYASKAIMSLDGLIRPISTNGDGGLPRYMTGYGLHGCQQISPASYQTPVLKGDGLGGLLGDDTYYGGQRVQEQITLSDLNPFSNPTDNLLTLTHGNGSGEGHDIDMVARGTGAEDDEHCLMMPIAGYDNPNKADYQDGYRPFALRGPLLIHGWGYDTDGKPVPNEVDGTGGDGLFVSTNATHRFKEGWLSKPETWPVAPVDLRLDRQRGVWTIPSGPRPLKVRIVEDLCVTGSALAEVNDSKPLYDDDGNDISDPMIYVFSAGQYMPSGQEGLAIFDNYTCNYYMVNCSADGIFPFQLQACMPFNGPGVAKHLRNEGNTYVAYGPDFDVYPGIPNAFGPAPSGFTGWAKIIVDETAECTGEAPLSYATIVNMDRYAEYIEFETSTDFIPAFGRPAVAAATATYYWGGSNPTTSDIYVSLGEHMTKIECFPAGTRGVAVFDPRFTDDSCNELMYNAIDVNQLTRITESGCGGVVGLDDYEAREFIFSTGIGVEAVSACKVRIFSKMRATGSDTCVNYDDRITTGDYYFEKLIFGKGLSAKTGEGCSLELNAGLKASKITECVPSGTIQNKLYNTIQFGKGLNIDHVDNCTMKIGAGVEASTSTGCIDAGTVTENKAYSILKFGKGINVNEVGDCTLEIGLGFTIGGTQVTALTLGDCLELTGGPCTATLDFKNKPGATGVEYVHDVECSGDSIVITKKTMLFNGCGQFIGISG